MRIVWIILTFVIPYGTAGYCQAGAGQKGSQEISSRTLLTIPGIGEVHAYGEFVLITQLSEAGGMLPVMPLIVC